MGAVRGFEEVRDFLGQMLAVAIEDEHVFDDGALAQRPQAGLDRGAFALIDRVADDLGAGDFFASASVPSVEPSSTTST